MKPLFIPLRGQYFDAFEAGDKDTEFRLYGPRWNERTCVVGRPVVLSRGYGKHRRLRGVITNFSVHSPSMAPAFRAFREIYGSDHKAACIRIALTTNAGTP